LQELEMQAKSNSLNMVESSWQNPSEQPSSMMNNYVKVEDGRNLITLSNAMPHTIQVINIFWIAC